MIANAGLRMLRTASGTGTSAPGRSAPPGVRGRTGAVWLTGRWGWQVKILLAIGAAFYTLRVIIVRLQAEAGMPRSESLADVRLGRMRVLDNFESVACFRLDSVPPFRWERQAFDVPGDHNCCLVRKLTLAWISEEMVLPARVISE